MHPRVWNLFFITTKCLCFHRVDSFVSQIHSCYSKMARANFEKQRIKVWWRQSDLPASWIDFTPSANFSLFTLKCMSVLEVWNLLLLQDRQIALSSRKPGFFSQNSFLQSWKNCCMYRFIDVLQHAQQESFSQIILLECDLVLLYPGKQSSYDTIIILR